MFINLSFGHHLQISKVKDFNININILESRPIVNLKVPKIREDVEFNHDIHSGELIHAML